MTSGDELAAALAAAYPELAEVAAAAPDRVYLVGGAVRDLLLGRGRADIDLVVEGDPAARAEARGAEVVESHPRFGTLKAVVNGGEVESSSSGRSLMFAAWQETLDIAATRRERYPRPG